MGNIRKNVRHGGCLALLWVCGLLVGPVLVPDAELRVGSDFVRPRSGLDGLKRCASDLAR